MLKVGLTGGIGSGKTLIASMFKILGVPVYDADSRAKELVQTNPSIKNAIINLLGEAAFSSDGKYNTKFVASKVFQDKELLAQLNVIIHPFVKEDTREWMQKHSKSAFIIKEAALLFESGANEDLDFVIYVAAPLKLRVNRVIVRDKVKKADVLRRIANQWPEKLKQDKSDFIIKNNERKAIIPQVFKLYSKLNDIAFLSSNGR